MLGRPRRQIVEDKAASPECNPILHVPVSFPRTRGLWGGESVGSCSFLEVRLQHVSADRRRGAALDCEVTVTSSHYGLHGANDNGSGRAAHGPQRLINTHTAARVVPIGRVTRAVL